MAKVEFQNNEKPMSHQASGAEEKTPLGCSIAVGLGFVAAMWAVYGVLRYFHG